MSALFLPSPRLNSPAPRGEGKAGARVKKQLQTNLTFQGTTRQVETKCFEIFFISQYLWENSAGTVRGIHSQPTPSQGTFTDWITDCCYATHTLLNLRRQELITHICVYATRHTLF